MASEKVYDYIKELKLRLVNTEERIILATEKLDLIDEDGYLYYLSSQNLATLIKRNGTPSTFFNKNPYTSYNIENYLEINNIQIELVDIMNIDKAIVDIPFRCKIHKNIFYKTWNEVKNGTYCPECGKESFVKTRQQDFEMIKKAFKERGYELLTKEYFNNWQELEYICEKHRNMGIQTIQWREFINGRGCTYCSNERVKFNRENYLYEGVNSLKSPEKFEEEVKILYGNKFTILTPYSSCKIKITCFCNDCKTKFKQSPNHLLEGHLACDCKEKSLGESMIKEIFENNNVSYFQQHRINECRNKKPLPFDFIVYEDKEQTTLKYLIEFQGKQHYENTNWSSNLVRSEKDFEQRKINDAIKVKYCLDNKINLIIIPYWDIRKMEEIFRQYSII